jgi:hypothetical protein
MAESNPQILDATIPGEAQPNNTFPVEVRVRQGGPDPWGSDGACTSQNLDVAAWRTPIELVVDGDVVDERELCLASGNTKSATLTVSLEEGTHQVTVRVYSLQGTAYDLRDPVRRISDEFRSEVEIADDARDPSRPSAQDRIGRFLERIASALGGTTTQVAAGAALALVALLVVGI